MLATVTKNVTPEHEDTDAFITDMPGYESGKKESFQ